MKPVLDDAADRERIANDLGTTLVVEAAAGTGKTTELVRRMLRVLETGRAKVKEMVAVTFTEKAAGELKLRLREALERARETRAGEPDVRGRLDEALASLEEAHVNTIHGFCADLLRERPVEARVDPLFTVMAEAQSERLFSEAFAGWLQEQLEDPPEGVRRSLRRSSGFYGGDAGDADGPVERLRRAALSLSEWRDFPAPWQRPDFDRERAIEVLVAQLDRFAELSARPSYARDPLYLDTESARRVSRELRVARKFGQMDDDGWEARLVDLSRDREFTRARKGSGQRYGDGVDRERVAAARQGLDEALKRFRHHADADLAALLHAELQGCLSRYASLKARAGALDFLDLLLMARNLICDDVAVRTKLQKDFQRIFVDEFQDTDPLQAEILLLLSADDPSVTDWRRVRPAPGKLFIVGDPKQSIYRFRRADVGIYQEVCDLLERCGAERVLLRTSFRSAPSIQHCVNAAFAPLMTGDAASRQAHYVPLAQYRETYDSQPALVALPVPEPYGKRRIAGSEIEKSLPDAVGAFVDWLINESGWQVAERRAGGSPMREGVARARGFDPAEAEHRVPIQARHVCILFRRFVSFTEDVTRPYVDALEARNVPHLLVGGKAFHEREEVEFLRAALAAIEWPDDELSVFGTVRGPLFAAGDEELLEYRHRFGRLHPFRVPADVPEHLASIVEALRLLRDLHAGRNRRPVVDTITRLLEATRAHVSYVLAPRGEQALANVLHVAERARQYELAGGLSFRGFVEELQDEAGRAQAAEAPILEEGSDGVRLMTVHKAKGLEFPVVILADPTCRLRREEASRYLDPARGLCVLRLGGWSPIELLEHEAGEVQCDEAEAVRLAYVAATRARDLLVVPAVGDSPWEGGWLQPFSEVIYPPFDRRRTPQRAPGCPDFRSKDTVLRRPDGDPARLDTMSPGLHRFRVAAAAGPSFPIPRSEFRIDESEYSVVWWDPSALALKVDAPFGVRREELIVRDVPAEVVEDGRRRYETWRADRERAIEDGSRPSLTVRTVTEWAASAGGQSSRQETGAQPATAAEAAVGPGFSPADLPPVTIIELPRAADRPSGPRYGALVHAVLATVPLDATAVQIRDVAVVQGRIAGATEDEVASSAEVVREVLAHPLLARARAASHCYREVPITYRLPDGTLLEGTIDLLFADDLPPERLAGTELPGPSDAAVVRGFSPAKVGPSDAAGVRGFSPAQLVVVDFKTDRELSVGVERYRRQVQMYGLAVREAMGAGSDGAGLDIRAVLMRI